MLIEKDYDSRTKHFIKRLSILNSVKPLPNSIKALELLIAEMNKEKGFKRHDGRDYYGHPIAVADTALDFGIIQKRWDVGLNKEADQIITVCLLHDILEDVDWVNADYLVSEFGYDIYRLIDNVTKRPKGTESMESYLDRVSSHEISAVVKILDRLNNMSTMSESSTEHRHRQLIETRDYYVPLTKNFRNRFIVDAPFYWQARTILNALCNEVARSDKLEFKENN